MIKKKNVPKGQNVKKKQQKFKMSLIGNTAEFSYKFTAK